MNNTKFIKFPSISNTYRIDDLSKINRCVYSFVGDDSVNRWVATEKIDGMNIQIAIQRDCFVVYSRNQLMGKKIVDAVFVSCPWINQVIANIQTMLKSQYDNVIQINLYGEYFGRGIQNRVFYGDQQQVLFFAGNSIEQHNVVWWSRNILEQIASQCSFSDKLVPIVATTNTIEQAFELSCDFVSKLTDQQHNSASEGIVITHYNVPLVIDIDKGRHVVIGFKKKSEKFLEVSRDITNRVYKQHHGDVLELRDRFIEYCTQSRMYSVFSKLGNPNNHNDSGKYLSSFIRDAIEDFVVDYPEFNELEKLNQKFVTNIGNRPYILFEATKRKINESASE